MLVQKRTNLCGFFDNTFLADKSNCNETILICNFDEFFWHPRLLMPISQLIADMCLVFFIFCMMVGYGKPF